MSRDLFEPIRSHKDLDKDAVPHWNKALKFYDALSKQLVTQGHVLDLFASALDQVSPMPHFWMNSALHLQGHPGGITASVLRGCEAYGEPKIPCFVPKKLLS